MVLCGFLILIDDPVDLVPFFRFDHNMQQLGTAATQYVVVFCYLLILNQQSHRSYICFLFLLLDEYPTCYSFEKFRPHPIPK